MLVLVRGTSSFVGADSFSAIKQCISLEAVSLSSRLKGGTSASFLFERLRCLSYRAIAVLGVQLTNFLYPIFKLGTQSGFSLSKRSALRPFETETLVETLVP